MTQPSVPLPGQQAYEPSKMLTRVLSGVSPFDPVMARRSEFATELTARLAAVAMNPNARDGFENALDREWNANPELVLLSIAADTEVIIGSGFHAATYAAMRVLSGHPRPVVLERSSRVGGTFGMTAAPSFHLNSRNRSGPAGLSGDGGTNLNYLPGAPIQTDHLGTDEYQTNAAMGFVIRATLAQFARVAPEVTVEGVVSSADGLATLVLNDDGDRVTAGRVIDARGLGDPRARGLANGTTVLTFAQFMRRMVEPWPFRGVRRVAVVGNGDSARCAVEAVFGLGPQPPMANRVLDRVERVDWYGEGIPDRCKAFRKEARERYAAIGRYLRADGYGVRPLVVDNTKGNVTPLPYGALVNGKTYDMVVMCTGNERTSLTDSSYSMWYDETPGENRVIAMRSTSVPLWQVGPCANLRFDFRDAANGITDVPENAVSMFRTAPKTATLATQLPPLPALVDRDEVTPEVPF